MVSGVGVLTPIEPRTAGTLLILQLICLYFMLAHIGRHRKEPWIAGITLVLLVGGFLIPYGWLIHLIAGGLCWADARTVGAGRGF